MSDYLIDRADGTALRMIPPAGRQLFESPRPDDQLLVETLQAYARADMALAATAEQLAVHPNTVAYRLRKVSRLLERDVTRFSDLAEVGAWARIVARARAAG